MHAVYSVLAGLICTTSSINPDNSR